MGRGDAGAHPRWGREITAILIDWYGGGIVTVFVPVVVLVVLNSTRTPWPATSVTLGLVAPIGQLGLVWWLVAGRVQPQSLGRRVLRLPEPTGEAPRVDRGSGWRAWCERFLTGTLFW